MQLGSDSAPGATIAPSFPVTQAAQRLSFPSGSSSRVFSLGGYVRALSGYGPIDYRLCIWAWNGGGDGANKLLGRTYVHSATGASSAVGNLERVTWYLEEPLVVGPYAEVLVGVAWETDPARAINLGGSSGAGHRWRKDAAGAGSGWPISMSGATQATDHDQTAWIEDYEPASGVFVYRAGAWVELPGGDAVLVQRGAYAEPAGVRVRRSGAWVVVRPAGG